MRSLANFFKLALLGTVIAGSLAACNTFEGVGQDVQSGGRAIEGTANDVQRKM
ncbi:entericidin A/B family lipoprotein [Azospirillum sp. SYSU D00513]|uniref:entericidin A/B family lipoprotein n=1 Tax=Azospirillum sp. SYSU D00513 TaxID=2812561 RepID=UPI001A9621F9|nr:entericidin A/B family lipoprotein [Azospirillum sp. SYSU D00513]